ncbi:hypothetical protein BS47DRAFT_39403 [Hydnum rufescens UP504]|uniref:Uncharacterized protein n=1 Tax=Hydnum rufescens UP504 TaxID=1448309 RepID=A0A9P6DTP5_9AGAM|nr:hypothetical protein BS47DRAFT_39403 [Hydnum rufescens UP504]
MLLLNPLISRVTAQPPTRHRHLSSLSFIQPIYIPALMLRKSSQRPQNDLSRVKPLGSAKYAWVRVPLNRIRMESEWDGFPVTTMIKFLQSLRHMNVINLRDDALASVYVCIRSSSVLYGSRSHWDSLKTTLTSLRVI